MFSLRPTAALFTLGALALASAPALADDVHYNQVSVRAEVSQEVQRDLMTVTLYTESQNTDPAKLAAGVTETLNKALGEARQVKDINIRQGSRNSYPIYDDKGQKITGWRERAELRLESADFAALSKLTGDLLGGDMKMAGMDFSCAQGQRRRVAQRRRHRLPRPRQAGHRRTGRHRLQAGQHEPQHVRLPAALPASAGHDDEGRAVRCSANA
jgi:predicted secreted protein